MAMTIAFSSETAAIEKVTPQPNWLSHQDGGFERRRTSHRYTKFRSV
jgi:hypothetical protein